MLASAVLSLLLSKIRIKLLVRCQNNVSMEGVEKDVSANCFARNGV